MTETQDDGTLIDYNDVSCGEIVSPDAEKITPTELSSMRLQGCRAPSRASGHQATTHTSDKEDYREELEKSKAILQYMTAAEEAEQKKEMSLDRFETFIASSAEAERAKKGLTGFQPVQKKSSSFRSSNHDIDHIISSEEKEALLKINLRQIEEEEDEGDDAFGSMHADISGQPSSPSSMWQTQVDSHAAPQQWKLPLLGRSFETEEWNTARMSKRTSYSKEKIPGSSQAATAPFLSDTDSAFSQDYLSKVEMLFGIYQKNILNGLKTSPVREGCDSSRMSTSRETGRSRSFRYYSFGSRPNVGHPNRIAVAKAPQLLEKTLDLSNLPKVSPTVSQSNLFGKARLNDKTFKEYTERLAQRPLLQTTLFYFSNLRRIRSKPRSEEETAPEMPSLTEQSKSRPPELQPSSIEAQDDVKPQRYFRTLTPSTELVRHVHQIDGVERTVDNEYHDLVVYVGMRLLGWLEVVSLLGKGSFGQVFVCKDLRISDGHFVHPERIACDDFAYWNCCHDYLPDGNVDQVPLHSPLVAVKVVKSEPLIESQSVLEAEMLVFLGSHTIEETDSSSSTGSRAVLADPRTEYIARVLADGVSYGHHCIVMEQYGANLYEFVSSQPHRGLPMYQIRSMGIQLFSALSLLEDCHIIHADIKPENMLLTLECSTRATNLLPGERSPQLIPLTRGRTTADVAFQSTDEDAREKLEMSFTGSQRKKGIPVPNPNRSQPLILEKHTSRPDALDEPSLQLKLIDFSSSCYVGGPLHTYIQSRYYRAPEVILQAGYSSAIDIWSSGCVLAELLLGLPLMPGATAHHQIALIEEVLGPIPYELLSAGNSTSLYYHVNEEVGCPSESTAKEGSPGVTVVKTPGYTLRSREEYLESCGLPNDTVYRHFFSYKTLRDLVRHCPLSPIEKQITVSPHPGFDVDVADIRSEILQQRFLLFNLLKSLLQPDPTLRPTASQVLQHPFFTNKTKYTDIFGLK